MCNNSPKMGGIFKDSNVTVEAFRHEHGSLPGYGFRFVSTDRVIVWAGYGKQGAAFQAAAMKVKRLVLIHESNYSNPYDPEALLKAVKQFYTGDVISSRDGGIF